VKPDPAVILDQDPIMGIDFKMMRLEKRWKEKSDDKFK
jgi:hypothetical protein